MCDCIRHEGNGSCWLLRTFQSLILAALLSGALSCGGTLAAENWAKTETSGLFQTFESITAHTAAANVVSPSASDEESRLRRRGGAQSLDLQASAHEPQAQVRTWTAVEELRIGSLNDPDQALSRVTGLGLAITARGDILVAQPDAAEIRVYESSGRFVRTMGRRGDGPGEFRNLVSIGVVGEEIYAVNAQPPRVEYFSPSGEHLRTVPYRRPVHEFSMPTPPYVIFPSGGGIVSPALTPDWEGSVTSVLIDRSENVIDTMLSYPAIASRAPLRCESARGTVRTAVAQPLRQPQPFAFDPSGTSFWTVDMRVGNPSGTFRIVRRNADGDTIYSRSYDYRPTPIPRAVLDSARASAMETINRCIPNRGEAERLAAEILQLPTHFPPVLALRSGDAETVWVNRSLQVGATEQRWELHDSSGSPVAALLLPTGVDAVIFRNDHVWGIVHDELEVPYVVRLRIQR